MIIITANNFAGTLFVQTLLKKNVPIEEIFLVSDLRGPWSRRVRHGFRLLIKKSPMFLFYKLLVEKIYFQLMCIDGKVLKSIEKNAFELGIPVSKIQDVNSIGFINRLQSIRQKAPEIIIVSAYGSQIFPPQLLSEGQNFWNIHGSYLPYYKGAAPYFWMKMNQSFPSGVTLHEVVEKLDSGRLIEQVLVLPHFHESLFVFHGRCIKAGAELVVNAYKKICLDQKITFKEYQFDQSELKNHEGRFYGIPKKDDVKKFFKEGHRFVRASDFSLIQKLFV